MGVAQAVAPQKLKLVQRQIAVHLQASNRWKEAEEAYIKVYYVIYFSLKNLPNSN